MRTVVAARRTIARHSRRSGLAVAAWFAAVAATLPGSPAAAAADWAERAFNPAVGSRWTIQSVETESDQSGATVVGTSTKKITALLTYEEKLPDGYRITFRRTDSSYEGDADDPATAKAALAAMQDHTYRAVTDPAGKPLRVENLAELRAAVRKMLDDVIARAATPQIAAATKQMMANFDDIDETRAAEKNLDDLPLMAAGQDTGFKIGETREQVLTEPSAGAPPLRKTVALTLVAAASDGANAHYKLIETTDPESMQVMLLGLLGKLDQSDPAVREQIDAVKKMQFTQTQQTEIEVVAGMTLRLDITMTTKKLIPGEPEVVIANHRVVTISPAP